MMSSFHSCLSFYSIHQSIHSTPSNQEVLLFWQGAQVVMSMDDLFPLFQYVVIRAKVLHLGSEIEFMQDMVEEDILVGEAGHRLTTLSVSCICLFVCLFVFLFLFPFFIVFLYLIVFFFSAHCYLSQMSLKLHSIYFWLLYKSYISYTLFLLLGLLPSNSEREGPRLTAMQCTGVLTLH